MARRQVARHHARVTGTDVVPGTLCVHVEEVRKGAAPASRWTEIAETCSVALAALREALGAADEGEVLDLFGRGTPHLAEAMVE
jgi:hypothetical protein